MSVTGSRKGSFLKINPSLETVLCSFQTICRTLDNAPKQWWNEGQETILEDEEVNLSPARGPNEGNDDGSSSDEEMVTLDVNNNEDEEDEELPSRNSNWLRDIDLDSDDDE